MDRVNTTVEEFLRGIRLIRALGREEWENRRFQASNGELEESGIRLQLLSAWFAPLVTLTVNLGIAAVLWAAGCGGAEAGTVSALVTYMTQMLTSLMTLIDVFKLLIRARTSVRRVEEVLALPEEGTLEGPEETGVEEPVLELRHVTFAYPGGSGVPALQDISFTLRRGERLAVVGPSLARARPTLAWPVQPGSMSPRRESCTWAGRAHEPPSPGAGAAAGGGGRPAERPLFRHHPGKSVHG